MKLTEQQKENISQLIRSESTHELGMQQARLLGYDKQCNWEYRLDYWYHKDKFTRFRYSRHKDVITITIAAFEIEFVIMDTPVRDVAYYMRFYYNRKHLINCETYLPINRLFYENGIDKKLNKLFKKSRKDGFIICDGVGLFEYVFEVIKQNQAIFNDYIEKVVE